MNPDPLELVTVEMLKPAWRDRVLALLETAPVSGAIKRRVYQRWCELAGADARTEDYRRLTRSVATMAPR